MSRLNILTTKASVGILKKRFAMDRKKSAESAVVRIDPRNSIERRSAYRAVKVKLTNTIEVVTNAVTMMLKWK